MTTSAPAGPVPRSRAGGAPARWGERLGAFLLDALAAVWLVLLVALASSLVGAVSESVAGVVSTVGYLGVLVLGVRDHVVVQGRTGQTLGKRRVGIRVLRLAGARPPGPALALGRLVAHLLDTWSLGLGWLWPLWDRRGQTFADKICHTVVVRT